MGLSQKKEDKVIKSLLFLFFVVFISILLRWVIHNSVTVTVPHLFFSWSLLEVFLLFFVWKFQLCAVTGCVYGLKRLPEPTGRYRKHIHIHVIQVFFSPGSKFICCGNTTWSFSVFLIYFSSPSLFFSSLEQNSMIPLNQPLPITHVPFHLWILRFIKQ